MEPTSRPIQHAGRRPAKAKAALTRRVSMPTKTQPESPAASAVSESLDGARTKAFETVSVLAEANQRVFAHLLELSSVAAREGARTYGDLQSAALNAVRSAPGAGMLFPANMGQLRQDPFAWYRQGIAAAAGATQ